MFTTLLLNSSWEPLSFIPLRKLIKLIVKEKVEVLEHWDDYIVWGSGKIAYPSVVRLKYYCPQKYNRLRFSRRGVFRRDMYICMYCGEAITHSKITLDHIIPVCKNGKSSWQNCVSSCRDCNTKKGNRTVEEAGMSLISKPYAPIKTLTIDYILIKPKHDSWANYFHDVESVLPKMHILAENI